MKSKKFQFTATTLRKLLSVAFILLILAIAGAFYYGLQVIRDYAVEVTHVSEDAKVSGEQINKLQQLRTQLAAMRQLVEKADRIFATDATYQSQAVSDLGRYADAAGVSIKDISFPQADQTAVGTRQVKLSLTQPVSYARLIRFLQLVEGSMPKMQVTELTVHHLEPPADDQVTVDDITFNISVR